ncbi:hypothetical protein [Streptomyces sp. NBC_01565]|uniref:hypothetical protein n=1 Tax=Streptomyces sp. NBC_01565 TaxID=2975881 RepID=UPI002255293D|nr:hypothetical protein [Streptomyces sp. NBC_01565]MCX4539241.1 hypothetical protein [Streptomyces sp. NBC_01565]
MAMLLLDGAGLPGRPGHLHRRHTPGPRRHRMAYLHRMRRTLQFLAQIHLGDLPGHTAPTQPALFMCAHRPGQCAQ